VEIFGSQAPVIPLFKKKSKTIFMSFNFKKSENKTGCSPCAKFQFQIFCILSYTKMTTVWI
jgi:hypothetical protein